MRFNFIVLLALVGCVMMEKFERLEKFEDLERDERREFKDERREFDVLRERAELKEELTRYFHKKMCYCIEARDAICFKLKCCDIYQYVPYKVFIKLCKFGECKFIERRLKEEILIPEKHAGVSA